MLQNPRVTAFTISELLRENQQRGWGVKLPPRLGLRLKILRNYKTSGQCQKFIEL